MYNVCIEKKIQRKVFESKKKKTQKYVLIINGWTFNVIKFSAKWNIKRNKYIIDKCTPGTQNFIVNNNIYILYKRKCEYYITEKDLTAKP